MAIQLLRPVIWPNEQIINTFRDAVAILFLYMVILCA